MILNWVKDRLRVFSRAYVEVFGSDQQIENLNKIENLKIKEINIAKDFSKFPAGRFRSDGKFSGERFRDDFLVPALKENDTVTVVLDGIAYASSFLNEVFAGLIKYYKFTEDDLRKKLKIVSKEDSSLITEVWSYISETKDKVIKSPIQSYIDEKLDYILSYPKMYGTNNETIEFQVLTLLEVRAKLFGKDDNFVRKVLEWELKNCYGDKAKLNQYIHSNALSDSDFRCVLRVIAGSCKIEMENDIRG
jgi:hypothetical protein